MHALALNLRSLRKQAGLTQAELAERSGLARASLAAMERPEANPGIESVIKVAAALSIGLDELLTPPPEERYVTVAAGDIQEYRASDGLFVARQVSPITSRGVQIQVVTMHPGCRSPGRPHPRGSQEFYYGWSGRCELLIAGDAVAVGPGSLVQFPGHLHHVYCNPDTAAPCHGLSVVVVQQL